MITGAQIREARALLGWPIDKLARRSRLTGDCVRRAESVDGDPPVTIANIYAIERALEAAGVEFVAGDGSAPKVRLRNAVSQPRT